MAHFFQNLKVKADLIAELHGLDQKRIALGGSVLFKHMLFNQALKQIVFILNGVSPKTAACHGTADTLKSAMGGETKEHPHHGIGMLGHVAW